MCDSFSEFGAARGSAGERKAGVRSTLLVAVLLGCGCLLTLAPSFLEAQTRFETSVGPVMALPLGSFADRVRTGCPGVSLGAGLRPGGRALLLGGEIAFLVYGHDRRRDPLTPSQPEYVVPRTVWNTIMEAHVFARWSFAPARLTPFVEALAGISSLRTDSNVEGAALAENYPGIRSILHTDTAVSGGVGVGVTVLVRDAREAQPDPRRGELTGARKRILLDIDLRWIGGGRADYLIEDSIREVGGETVYGLIRSPTSRLTGLVRLRWIL